jgi:tetratricopeptide (TPR) repeat protein
VTQIEQINEQAFLAYKHGDYRAVERLSRQAYDLGLARLGERHPDTITSLNNLAEGLASQGRYSEAEPLYRRAIELGIAVWGERDPSTLRYLDNLAKTLIHQRRFSEAEPLLRRALEVSTALLGERHPDTIISLHNLAFALNGQGRAGEAEPLFRRALELGTAVRGERDPETITSLNNLAAVINGQGRAGEAARLYRRVLELRTAVLGERDPNTIASLDNLAFALCLEGRYGKAEPLLRRALELRTAVLGERAPGTIISLSNLAQLLDDQGRTGEAEPLYRRALELSIAVLGERHPDTIISLDKLAFSLCRQGRYGEAEPFLRHALDLRTRVLGERHPDTIANLNTLATALDRQGRYGKAEPLYRRALALSNQGLGERHPDTLAAALNLGVVLFELDRPAEAAAQLAWGEGRLHGWVAYEAPTASRDWACRGLLGAHPDWLNVIISAALRVPSDATTALAARAILRWKHRLAEESGTVERVALRDDDPTIRALATGIQALRSEVRRLYRSGNDATFQARLDDLEAESQELHHHSDQFRQASLADSMTVPELQARLPAGSVLVEFRLFHPIDFKAATAEPLHLAGLLIEPDQAPRLYDAGPVDTLPNVEDDDGSALFERAFGPVAERLRLAQTVYVAPDGTLLTMSPAALRLPAAEGGGWWGERQKILVLGTGRALLAPADPSTTSGTVAFGAVDYELTGATTHAAADGVMTNGVMAGTSSNSGREVEAIRTLVTAAWPDQPFTLWQGADATERRLRSLATHGEYRNVAPGSESDWAEVLAWVALAGADRELDSMDDGDDEGGLLRALAVTGLNLDGTELVVLSAFKSGQTAGDSSEGLIAVTRSFRIAGARYVLAALRKVDDGLTADFMIAFYRNWLAQKPNQSDPPAALLQTQRAAAHGDLGPKAARPRFWGAFVMIGY